MPRKKKAATENDELPGQRELSSDDSAGGADELQPVTFDSLDLDPSDDDASRGREEKAGGSMVDLSTALGCGFEPTGDGAPVALLALDPGTEHIIQPFQKACLPVQVHLVKGYRRCTGEGCFACAGGLRKQVVFLWPVWNSLEERIEVLRISPSKDSRSFGGQVKKLLSRSDFDTTLFKVSKTFNNAINITEEEVDGPVEESTAQLEAIKAFSDKLAIGKLRLEELVPPVELEELEEKHPNFQRRLDWFTRQSDNSAKARDVEKNS